jgi:hypothetical protein
MNRFRTQRGQQLRLERVCRDGFARRLELFCARQVERLQKILRTQQRMRASLDAFIRAFALRGKEAPRYSIS